MIICAGSLSLETRVELCVCVCATTFGDANVRSAMDSIVNALHFPHGKIMNNHDHLPSSTDSEGFKP